MVPLEAEARRFVAADGTEIAYQVFGDGPPLLLCNGLGGRWSVWAQQIAYFRDRYRILCWDYRGLYDSGRPDSLGKLTVRNHAEDALRLLEEEGVDRFALVGWSMGVQVGLELFRLAPEKIASLAFVNGVAGRPWDYVFSISAIGRFLPQVFRGLGAVPGVVEAVVAQAARLPETARWTKRVGLAAGSVDEETLSEIIEDFGQLDMRTYVRTLEMLGEHDAWDLLPQIDVPTLIVVGSRDLLTPRAAAERMARRIRGAEVMIVPGATHYAMLEYPEMLNLRLEKFFRERGYDVSRAHAG